MSKAVILLFAFLTSTQANAFDLTKMRCLREEHQGARIFLSEINFKKAGLSANRRRLNVMNRPSEIEGELVSYSLNGTTKKYVSGYNLFSVFYRDGVVSGLTGDPVTSADGVFTLSKLDDRNSGIWKFVYSNRHGTKIDADFKCVFKKKDSLID